MGASRRVVSGGMMGHDHHFLSRLDRAGEQHIELALSLYRDADLTEYLAATASVATPTKSGGGHRGERIAVSLERDEGPYVILTADGHFVTCLAQGMTPGTLFVFPGRGGLENVKMDEDRMTR